MRQRRTRGGSVYDAAVEEEKNYSLLVWWRRLKWTSLVASGLFILWILHLISFVADTWPDIVANQHHLIKSHGEAWQEQCTTMSAHGTYERKLLSTELARKQCAEFERIMGKSVWFSALTIALRRYVSFNFCGNDIKCSDTASQFLNRLVENMWMVLLVLGAVFVSLFVCLGTYYHSSAQSKYFDFMRRQMENQALPITVGPPAHSTVTVEEMNDAPRPYASITEFDPDVDDLYTHPLMTGPDSLKEPLPARSHRRH